MLEAYKKFLELPSRRSYLAVRARIIGASDWPPEMEALSRLTRTFQRGNYAAVLQLGERMSDSWLLCPRIHYILAESYEATRQPAEAELSRFESRSCLTGLTRTGAGTTSDPFLVLYPTDALDIVHGLGKMQFAQRFVHDARRPLDLIECTDGTDLWFDSSALVGAQVHARRRLTKSERTRT